MSLLKIKLNASSVLISISKLLCSIIVHRFVLYTLKKANFLTFCVFWFVFLNVSSHLRFWLFRLACRSRWWLCSVISIIRGHISLWRFDNDSSESVFFALEWVVGLKSQCSSDILPNTWEGKGKPLPWCHTLRWLNMVNTCKQPR